MLLSEFLKDGVASLESLYPTAEAKAVVLQLCSEILGTKNYTHIIEPLSSLFNDGFLFIIWRNK